MLVTARLQEPWLRLPGNKTETQEFLHLYEILVNFTAKRTCPKKHLLGDFQPGLLEAEDGAAIERGCDLQHGVVVVEAAADVSHRHPFLNHCHTHVDIVPVEDLCGDPVADLTKEQENK